MKQVLLCSSQPYTIELATRLSERFGWQPAYWLTTPSTVDEVYSRFPNVKTHDYLNSVKGIPANGFKRNSLLPVDVGVLERLAGSENNVLYMMERNDSYSRSFSYKERVDFYHYLVRYWSTILVTRAIDIVLFEEEPHQASDYVLYLLCHVLGVETVMFVRTIGDFGILAVRRFEHGSAHLRDVYHFALHQEADDLMLSEEVDKYLGKLRGEYEDVLAIHLWDQVDELVSSNSRISSAFGKLSSAATRLFDVQKHLARLRLIRTFRNDQKLGNRPLWESEQGYFSASLFKILAILKKKRNRRMYNHLVDGNVDLSKPFVLCALQYQPEKSTCPVGGRFVDQILLVETLAKLVPYGWGVYVKEHPSQFVSSYTRYGEQFRDRRYYERLASLPNVSLLPLDMDVFSLIDQSVAVCSVGGTICWEAVVRGTPSLCFGHAWFKDCEGVYFVNHLDDIRRALDEIHNNEKVVYEKVRAFAYSLEQVTYPGVVGGPLNLEHEGLTTEQNADAHLEAIQALLDSER